MPFTRSLSGPLDGGWSTVQPYTIVAIIATTIENPDGTTTSVAPGYALNRIMWDGSADWACQAGTEARADPNGALPIGSTTTV
jgi:hypothetical protein